MPLDLVRIDDRLVHGQVVIAWGTFLNTSQIILCNDDIAQSEFEKDLYMNAEEIAPHPLKINVYSQTETLEAVTRNNLENESIILLIETPKDILDLVDNGLHVDKINVGGMHFKSGKNQLASYIYVSDEDLDCFKKLHERGITLEGKDVPNAKAIDISSRASF